MTTKKLPGRQMPRGYHPAMSANELGTWGEQCGRKFLEHKGYRILARNWRTRGGELDIIAYRPDQTAVVAVEVKTRRAQGTGTPEESITLTKLRRIKGLLLSWLVQQEEWVPSIGVEILGITVDAGSYYVSHTVVDE